jgi:hypothetical protein
MATRVEEQKARKEAGDTTGGLALYSYWRSSCSWRVRIALEWKGLAYEYRAVHLVRDGGEHLADAFSRCNPNQVRCRPSEA